MPTGGEGPTPPNAWIRRGEGRIVLVEGDEANDLTLGRVGCDLPLEVSSHVCCEPWISTGPHIPLS